MLNRNLIIFFFLFLFYQINCQNREIDSLLINYEDKAWESILNENDSGLYYSSKIIDLAKKNNLHFKEIIGYEYRGIYNEEVLNNYEDAIEDYLNAIKIAELYKPDYLADLYVQIGILFFRYNNFEKANFYLNEALSKTKKYSDTYNAALINLAYTQIELEKFEKATSYFSEAIKIDSLGLNEKEASLLGLGKTLNRQKKYEEAQYYYNQAINLRVNSSESTYWENYLDFVDNAVRLKDISGLKDFLPRLISFYKNIDSPQKKLGFYDRMIKTYKLFEDYKNTSLYQDSIIILKNEISESINNKNLNELETQYQTRKKEEQIVEEQKKKELWVFLAIIGFIIIIIVGILLYKNNKKRALLNANKLELEKLLNQRNMLLRETHHRVKNSFQMVSSLLQLQAQGSEAEAAVTALNNAVERVNSMIVLHQQLYAKDDLLGVDLQLYIKDLVKEILQSYPSENIKIDANIIEKVVDIDTATSLGLLINELATNSIKYAWNAAEASEKIININLEEVDEQLHFKMFDNGSNKKTSQTSTNYGSELIEILIERLEAKKQTFKNHDFGLYLKFKT